MYRAVVNNKKKSRNRSCGTFRERALPTEDNQVEGTGKFIACQMKKPPSQGARRMDDGKMLTLPERSVKGREGMVDYIRHIVVELPIRSEEKLSKALHPS